MPLTVSVSLGYTPQDGVELSAADLAALGLPVISLSGSVGAADMEDGAVTWPKLSPTLVQSGTAITALATGDLFMIGDISAGINATITAANVLAGLLGLSAAATAFQSYTGDSIVYWQALDGTAKSMSPARFVEQLINQAPELLITADADGVLVTEASAAAGSKVKLVALENLLPDRIAAQTVSNPTSIQINTKGQVVAIANNGTGARYDTPTASAVTLPTLAGFANGVDVNTGLGARPGIVQGWLVCSDAGGDAGWAQNDIIPISWVKFDTTASTYFNGEYGLVPNGSAGIVRLVQPDNGGSGARVIHKTTGDDAAFTSTKWKLLVSAIR